MSPKTPRKPSLPSTQQPDANAFPPQRIDTSLPPGGPSTFRLLGFPGGQEPVHNTGGHPNLTNTPPAVVVQAIPVPRSPHLARDKSPDTYWLRDEFLRGMKPAEDDGFRWIVGRQFVDVEHEGRLRTTHVGQDAAGVYRCKLLAERTASGSVLYRNEGRLTWRLTEHPAPAMAPTKRPAPSASDQPGAAPVAKRPRPAHLDSNRYKASLRSPDAQGYYELTPAFAVNPAVTQFAFRDQFGRWIPVDPPAGGFAAQPAHLQHWTDHEIWQTYDLHGQELVRFRVEAQANGKRPQWAEPVVTNPHTDLLRDALRWLQPTMNLKQREAFLQSYNLLPSQLTRLQHDLKTEPKMPQWAQAHKRLIDDVDNPQRLEQMSRDAVEALNLKRDARHDWYNPETSLTAPVREALLSQLGYRRNKNNCLYRTDVPALFRGDERTPFELASDGFMLPRYQHSPGATTHKPMSATFSLKEGKMYARAPDPEYLRFNRQTNKHPGREADDSASGSDASDTESTSSSEWSDAASPVPWDHDRHYASTRTRQQEMFLYVLDTRHLEVVPHEENMSFNSAARDTPPTWFPDDDFEGLISVSRSGLGAERIWLLNSALTKAMKIDDIRTQAGASAERIEAATHGGQPNKFEYDQLIDNAEAAGKPVLRLSGNGDEFAYDINWPEPPRPTSQNQ
ncbi:Gln_amidase domain-containing protein [Pseudomonas sp. IT-347P]